MKFKFYTMKLCGFIVLVFLAQSLISGFTEFFILDGGSWGQIWRFVGAIFLHDGLAHLIYNLFALILFGNLLEVLIGGRRFLAIFLISGILANLVAINFYSNLLGASGAIFGVIGALIVIRPMLVIWAFGMPMPIVIAGILWGVGDFIGAYGFLAGNPIDDTGNIAHLSGMAFGLVLGTFYKGRAKGKMQNFRSERDRGGKIEIDESVMSDWEEKYLR